MNHRYIITGAPGTGKSTLLHYLEQRGAIVVHEPARRILAEQRAKGGAALPETDPEAFTRLLLESSLEAWHKADAEHGPVLFDRGIPDAIAYARFFGIDEGPAWEAAKRCRYHGKVFICEPWEEIYANDDERKMSFAQSVEFHRHLLDVYEVLDYQLIPLPQRPVSDRAQVVMDHS